MLTRQEVKYLTLIIIIFVAAATETDIFLPALSDMMVAFSTTEGAIQSLLTWNFIGICLSGPFYGPLSDSYGRKKPLLIALSIFLLGSLLTLFSPNLDLMLWGRILQGLGSGGCFTLGTAIIFDSFAKERAIDASTHLNTIMPLIMAGAPLLGGYLNHNFGFRSNFLAIALFVLVSFVATTFFLKETLPSPNRRVFHIPSIARDFKTVLKSAPFWQLTVAMSLIFATYIAFLSASSLLFVVEFGINKALFPLVQGTILGGWVAGSLLLKRALAKWGMEIIKKTSWILTVGSGLCFSLMALLRPTDPYLMTAAMIIYAFGANWICGLYFPEGMHLFPTMRGTVASLITSLRLLFSALIVGLSSALYNGTIYPLALLIFLAIAVLFPLLYFYEKKRTLPISTV